VPTISLWFGDLLRARAPYEGTGRAYRPASVIDLFVFANRVYESPRWGARQRASPSAEPLLAVFACAARAARQFFSDALFLALGFGHDCERSSPPPEIAGPGTSSPRFPFVPPRVKGSPKRRRLSHAPAGPTRNEPSLPGYRSPLPTGPYGLVNGCSSGVQQSVFRGRMQSVTTAPSSASLPLRRPPEFAGDSAAPPVFVCRLDSGLGVYALIRPPVRRPRRSIAARDRITHLQCDHREEAVRPPCHTTVRTDPRYRANARSAGGGWPTPGIPSGRHYPALGPSWVGHWSLLNAKDPPAHQYYGPSSLRHSHVRIENPSSAPPEQLRTRLPSLGRPLVRSAYPEEAEIGMKSIESGGADLRYPRRRFPSSKVPSSGPMRSPGESSLPPSSSGGSASGIAISHRWRRRAGTQTPVQSAPAVLLRHRPREGTCSHQEKDMPGLLGDDEVVSRFTRDECRGHRHQSAPTISFSHDDRGQPVSLN